jgi:hypothetical protein
MGRIAMFRQVNYITGKSDNSAVDGRTTTARARPGSPDMPDWGADRDWHWRSTPEDALEQLLSFWQNARITQMGSRRRSVPS